MSETQTGGVSDDPGRIIHDLEERLKAQNATIIGQTAEIDRLKGEWTAEIDRLRTELQQTQAWRTAATDAHSQSEARRIEQQTDIRRLQAEWQTEFTAAQQLRAENESLTVRLQRAEVAAAEALQRWETTEQVCLRIITALAGVRS